MRAALLSIVLAFAAGAQPPLPPGLTNTPALKSVSPVQVAFSVNGVYWSMIAITQVVTMTNVLIVTSSNGVPVGYHTNALHNVLTQASK
jgi:hypothetical protein